MIPALLLVFALHRPPPWCPIPPQQTTTTTTPPPTTTTTTTEPRLIVLPPDPFPPAPPTATTTTTAVATIVDAAIDTRPAPVPVQQLPRTGGNGNGELVGGGVLTLLGGLFVAAGRRPPPGR